MTGQGPRATACPVMSLVATEAPEREEIPVHLSDGSSLIIAMTGIATPLPFRLQLLFLKKFIYQNSNYKSSSQQEITASSL